MCSCLMLKFIILELKLVWVSLLPGNTLSGVSTVQLVWFLPPG